jgi:hypothetical protein
MTIFKLKRTEPENESGKPAGTETGSPANRNDPAGRHNRREAILKVTGYAAFTAASMMAVLTPRQAVAASGYSTPAEAPTGNKSPGNRPSHPTDQ